MTDPMSNSMRLWRVGSCRHRTSDTGPLMNWPL